MLSAESLVRSLERQKAVMRGSLTLNPVENFPFLEDLEPTASVIHGLYNTDKLRSADQAKATKHQFAGRQRLGYDSKRIYAAWSDALGAADTSLRLLSGLQAHAAIFMALTRPGDRVLLLPERAGGHMATHTILSRLGLDIVDIEIDVQNHTIDVERTLAKLAHAPVKIVFIDRSEGLVHEDFSVLLQRLEAYSIFDGSQYLSNIIAGDFENPFESGFDLVVATVHKNFPGPQKALVATAEIDDAWAQLKSGLSAYVSSMHIASTYASGLMLSRRSWLKEYSRRMLENAVALERALVDRDVPVIRRATGRPPTHHLWMGPMTQDEAFKAFKALERHRIYVNYRFLPYDIGYGLRLGVSALTRLGLGQPDILPLADLVQGALSEPGSETRRKVRVFAEQLWDRAFARQDD